MPGLPPGHRGGDHQGHVPAAAKAATKAAARAAARQRHDPARSRSPRAELLEKDWGVAADVWSCPSFNELRARRPGRRALEPAASDRAGRACRSSTQQLEKHGGPVDRVDRLHARPTPSRSAPFMPKGRTYKVLGTDGFGRSDFRTKLREHLRGQPPLHRRRRAEGAGRRGQRAGGQGRRGDREVRHRRRQDQSAVRLTRTATGRTRTWQLIEVKVPDIGDFKDVEVIEVLVKPGDTRRRPSSRWSPSRPTRRRWRSRRARPAS